MVCGFRFLRIFFVFIFISTLYIEKVYALNIIKDSEIEEVINEVAAPLLKTAGLSKDSVNIYLYDDDDLNAFVAGGQNIFISSGLIAFSNQPELLAGVIAHEIGHIKSGHILAVNRAYKDAESKMIVSTLVVLVAAVASGSSESGVGIISAAQMGLNKSLMKFNRSQENSADNTAVKILNANKISSQFIVGFLNHLDKNHERLVSSKRDIYLRTHPLSSKRIENIKSRANFKGDEGYSKDIREKYYVASQKIYLFTVPLNMLLLNNSEYLPQYRDYFNSIIHFRFSRFQESEKTLKKQIIANPDNRFLYEFLGEIYKEQGDYEKANNQFEIAFKIKKTDETIKYLFIESLYNARKKLKIAEKYLLELLNTSPNNVMYWRLLAKINHKQKKVMHSRLANAWGSFLLGDFNLAEKHINTVAEDSIKSDKFYLRQYFQLNELLKNELAKQTEE